MAGLSAAGWAAERGARVVVLEKAADIGGSAIMSGGMLWTASSPGRMRMYGGGQEALGRVVLENGAIAGGVSTYSVGGKQYVAVASGNSSRTVWGTGGAATVFVFGLPDK